MNLTDAKRDPEIVQARKALHDKNVSNGRLACVGDVGQRFLEFKKTESACFSCRSIFACLAAVDTSDVPACFGDLLVYGEGPACATCIKKEDCSWVVDEIIYREGSISTGDPELDALLMGGGNVEAAGSSLPAVDAAESIAASNRPIPTFAPSTPVTRAEEATAVVAAPISPTPAPIPVDALTSSSEPPATPPVLRSSYRFPADEPTYLAELDRVSDLAPHELLRLIEEVSALFDSATGEPVPYGNIRPRFCALSIALNRRRIFPPVIRQTRVPRRVRGGKISADDSALSNDRQIIDLHWLAMHGHANPEPQYKSILDSETFRFRAASRFVAHGGKAAFKAQVLRISDHEQQLLAVIHSPAIRDRVRATEEGMIRVANVFARPDPRSRLSPERRHIMPQVCAALRIAENSPQRAARLMGEMFGIIDVDEAVMRKLRAVLERNTASRNKSVLPAPLR